ncbi:MAG: M48 family metalloprotease [Armatimonadota bacterium]|nr:M48 family metalloprotease [Armatimonadota bacterium]MDR5697024.1 M48 family metalloprotease [Armatimonadota bacterium]
MRGGREVEDSVRAAVCLILSVVALAVPAAAQSAEDRAEIEQGRRAAQQIERQLKVVTDPEVNERVTRIGRAIAAVTERPDLPWTFRVVEHRVPNAVALPGGYIYLTSAIVRILRTDHELAGLLAHEAAHVALRHHRRMEREALRTNLIVMLVAVLVRDANVAAGAQLLGGGLLSAFTREMEREADRAAVGYVLQTEWHPVGVLTLLERMAWEDLLTANVDPGAFRTHPTWAERLRAVENELHRRGVPIHRRISMGFLRIDVAEEELRGAAVGVIRVNGEVVMRLSGGRARADQVARRLDHVFNEDPSPFDVRAVGVMDEWTVRIGDERVLTVTGDDVRLLGRSARDLANDYAQRLRQAIAEDRRRRALGG